MTLELSWRWHAEARESAPRDSICEAATPSGALTAWSFEEIALFARLGLQFRHEDNRMIVID